MNAEQFIARVVAPGDHVAVFWKKPDGPSVTRFLPDARRGEAGGLLRWASGKGADAYVALASYGKAIPDGVDGRGAPKFTGERTHANAQNLRAFWIDIDVKRQGDKKGTNVYADRREALAWLLTFIQATGLPRPNLWVDSGYGYHVYWVLEDPMARAGWQPYADALAYAAGAHGFKCETGITSDAARILRPPETVNLKVPATPVPVHVLSNHSRGDYPNQLMLTALQPYVGPAAARAHGTTTVAGATTVVAGSSTSALVGGAPSHILVGQGPQMNAAAQANLPMRRDHEFAKIVPRCKQVEMSLAAGGNGDPYQLWYFGFLSLAHHCADGASYTHAISRGDPRYTPTETDKAVAQIVKEKATKDTGPPRCVAFDGWRPRVCTGCPHLGKILSPWNLGADDAGTLGGVVAQTHVPTGVITALASEMQPEVALDVTNQMFFFAHNWGGEPLIGHVGSDEVRAISEPQFRMMLANKYVVLPRTDASGKPVGVDRVPVGKWWLAHPGRLEYDRVLYDPEGTRSRTGRARVQSLDRLREGPAPRALG